MAKITEVPPPGKRKSPTRELLETIVVALVIALLVRTFLVEVYRVEGSSMSNTLYTGERLLVNKFVYKYVRPAKPGDIIVFQYPRDPGRDFIKRVVAVAGDKVAIRAGKVYVNGRLFRRHRAPWWLMKSGASRWCPPIRCGCWATTATTARTAATSGRCP